MAKRIFIVISILVLAAMVPAGEAAAFRLHDHDREGPYFGLGFGAGVVGATASDELGQSVLDDLGVGGGFNVNFRLGTALSEYITVGIESSGWVKRYDLADDAELTAYIFFAGVSGTIYPKNIGFYLRGAIGMSTVSGELKVPGESDKNPDPTYGFGGLVAGGYERRVLRRLAVGPQVEAAFLQPDGKLVQSAWYVAFTLQGNWYF